MLKCQRACMLFTSQAIVQQDAISPVRQKKNFTQKSDTVIINSNFSDAAAGQLDK